MSAEAQKGEDLNHNRLEQAIGLLVYVLITYTVMTPCLKGFNLTLYQWIGGIY